jgi:hypothetical protein
MASLALRQPLLHRVSWGALFAGFFFGFGVWMLLLALGAGIGFTAFNPRDLQSWQGLGIGFGIWGVIAGIISIFLAAWLAARLSAADSRVSGMLHGAALWGFMLVAGIWIATMAVGRAASGVAGIAGSAASAAGSAASEARGQVQGEGVGDTLAAGATAQLNDWLRQQGMSQVSQQQLRAAMNDVVGNATARIRQGQSPAEALDRESITASLAQHTNLSREEAQRAAEQVETQLSGQLSEAQQGIAQAGETAADATAVGAWAFFLYGILTLAAALFGGTLGAPRERYELPRGQTAPLPHEPLPGRV